MRKQLSFSEFEINTTKHTLEEIVNYYKGDENSDALSVGILEIALDILKRITKSN